MTFLELWGFLFSLMYSTGMWILMVFAPIGGKWKNPLPVMLIAWLFVSIPYALIVVFGEPIESSMMLPPDINAIAFWTTGPILLLINVLWIAVRRGRA